MANNEGKKFESLIEDSCKKQGVLCQRLKDGSSRSGKDKFGRGTIVRLKNNNPSDFILFNGKTMLYLECKRHFDRLPLDQLRQIPEMNKLEMQDNMICGFIIKLVKKKDNTSIVRFVDLETIRILIDDLEGMGRASISYEKLKNYTVVNSYLPPRARVRRLDIIDLFDKIEQ